MAKKAKRRAERIPSFRLHRPSGNGVVTLRTVDGKKDIYCGPHDDPASYEKYQRTVAAWLANNRILPTPKREDSGVYLTVAELVHQFLEWSEQHYRHKDGSQTMTHGVNELALQPVTELFGALAVDSFGPNALREVRQHYIDRGMVRTTVNGLASKVKRAFAWGVSHQLVRPETLVALRTVEGLQRGRTAAKEPTPTRPAPDEWIAKILPRLRPMLAALVVIQRATGARAGELCQLRRADLEIESKDLWWFTPRQSKGEHLGSGYERRIALGPKAIAALSPLLKGLKKTEIVFRQAWGKPLTPNTYAEELRRHCRKKPPLAYHRPHTLRHARLDELRRTQSLDVAAATAGHAGIDQTQHYARLRSVAAAKAARESG